MRRQLSTFTGFLHWVGNRDIVGEVDRIRRGLANPVTGAGGLKGTIEDAMNALGELVASQRPYPSAKSHLKLKKKAKLS